jgi:hypothetical protein
VACRSDGYAIRFFGSEHNSYNVDGYEDTVPYRESLKNTLTFLQKHLYQNGETGSIITEIDRTIGKVYSNEVVVAICGTIDAPDKDRDSDGLSNGDELLLFLTEPRTKDSDFDGVCDGKETIDFMNPAVFDTYLFPDELCFEIDDNESRENICYGVGVKATTGPPSEPAAIPMDEPTQILTSAPTKLPVVSPVVEPTGASNGMPTRAPSSLDPTRPMDSSMPTPHNTALPSTEKSTTASPPPTLTTERIVGSAAKHAPTYGNLHGAAVGWLFCFLL